MSQSKGGYPSWWQRNEDNVFAALAVAAFVFWLCWVARDSA